MSLWDQLVDFTDISNALYDIKREIEDAQEKIEKTRRNRTVNTHVQAALALSGLEIKMSNFAADLRKKFTASGSNIG
jgi:hypothetical protein